MLTLWLQALRFYNCNNLQLNGFTSLNRPSKHIGLQSCSNVSVSHLHIRVPKTSPNTDGILISGSSQINIFHSIIGTGDAIKSGSSHINIILVACGPGHGISVGSLGIGGGNHIVEEVHVRNCSFIGTTNGARIKTRKVISILITSVRYFVLLSPNLSSYNNVHPNF
ncbi:hypothetical protein TIFTF001_014340 [Ficus carica]|uniref:Polygalacturonase n=1 Tax=Ficus carica TaxID=3494 RepID=A0AA87ZZC3_FICCA|nr:hypothetical protein TIFTF001_014340 [Ficus carica]